MLLFYQIQDILYSTKMILIFSHEALFLGGYLPVINDGLVLGKLSNQKSNETWELVQSGDDPPPSGVGTFLNLGLY